MTETFLHIMLVSDQAAANLLPALDPSLKPKEARLVVTEKMRAKGQALGQVLREAGVKVAEIVLENEHDTNAIKNALLEAAENLPDGRAVALNLTGGTKLMSLSAQSLAEAAGWRTFYVDVDTDEVIWLDRKPESRQKLSSNVGLRHYVSSYGAQVKGNIERPQPAPNWDRLCTTLINDIGSLERPISQLNFLGQQAEKNRRLDVQMDDALADSRGFEALLRHFADAGVLRVDGKTILYSGEEGRSFAKGGWLEHHVYRTLDRIHGALNIKDKASNLKVFNNEDMPSEMDNVFLAKNRLWVIECKTSRMDDPDKPKANEALFKLAQNRQRIGGSAARAMLVSYRKMADSELKLGRALGIEIVQGTDLKRLDEKIRVWVGR